MGFELGVGGFKEIEVAGHVAFGESVEFEMERVVGVLVGDGDGGDHEVELDDGVAVGSGVLDLEVALAGAGWRG